MKTPSGILNARTEHDAQWLASSKAELEQHVDVILDKEFDGKSAVVSRSVKTRSGPSHPKTELEVIAQYEANGWDVRWAHGYWVFLNNQLSEEDKYYAVNRSNLQCSKKGERQ